MLILSDKHPAGALGCRPSSTLLGIHFRKNVGNTVQPAVKHIWPPAGRQIPVLGIHSRNTVKKNSLALRDFDKKSSLMPPKVAPRRKKEFCMKTWKHGIFGILAIIALTFVFIACGGDKDEHTHEWEWVVTTPATPTADGLETETCKTCGATNGTRPIAMLPKDQSDTLTNLFGEGYTATVTGYFSNTEWDGVPTKIENAINGAYAASTGKDRGRIELTFENNNVVIIVEKTTEYSTYKVVAGNKTTLHVNLDGLDRLQSKIVDATTAMQNGEAKQE
jgi:hypothetical protein